MLNDQITVYYETGWSMDVIEDMYMLQRDTDTLNKEIHV